MFLKLFFLLVLASSSFANLVSKLSDDIEQVESSKPTGNTWVVLVAGSNGYNNYRHQADVLHAYQLVQKIHKIPKERIILMMYDDIAYSPENPFKGNIINFPGGDNLYTNDIQKDFTHDEVTPENFLGVLLKDKKLIDSKKKVLNSTSDDFVFIYFTDHGAPSLVAFPNDILSATNLKQTLNIMQARNSFKKMAIYIEACESGSMFADDMNPNKGIYAITASSYNEPSYAKFYDKERKTYLADVFSINWLKDSYKLDSDNAQETLMTQYLHVKNKTVESHVCEYGDIEMAKSDYTFEFQGKRNNDSSPVKVPEWTDDEMEPLRSDEVEYFLTKIHSDFNNDDSFQRLIEGRRVMSRFIEGLRTKFADKLHVNTRTLRGKNKIEHRECYDELVSHLHKNCVPLHVHTYLFRHLYLFANTCNSIKDNGNVKTEDLSAIISEHCSSLRNSEIIQSVKVV